MSLDTLSALFSSPFFFLSFFLVSKHCFSVSEHKIFQSSAWSIFVRLTTMWLPSASDVQAKGQIAVRKTSCIFALISTQRLAPTGMSGSMPFEHCKSPLIVFESAKVSEVFDVRGK